MTSCSLTYVSFCLSFVVVHLLQGSNCRGLEGPQFQAANKLECGDKFEVFISEALHKLAMKRFDSYISTVRLCGLKSFQCEGALWQKTQGSNIRKIWERLGLNPHSVAYISLKTQQSRKQDEETRHKDQNKVNK